jgi:glycerol-3-phosphate dehydrogenase (NAD(P)+)
MALKNSSKAQPIGVIGVGSFGTAIANMLAEKNEVMVYARKQEVVEEINTQHSASGKILNPKIRATFSPEELCNSCGVLFFMIPSAAFLEVTRTFAPYLHPYQRIGGAAG